MRKTFIPILLFLCVSGSAETLYRLPVKSSVADTELITAFETALDTVFSRRMAQNYRIEIPDSSDFFPADGNVCTAEIELLTAQRYLYKIDFFYAGEAPDSFWSGSFELSSDKRSVTDLAEIIVTTLKTNQFQGTLLSRLQVNGTRGSHIYIDSALSEQTVPFEKFLPSGTYIVETRKNWYLREKTILNLYNGNDTSLTVDFWEKTEPLRIGTLVGSVLAGAGGLYLHYYQQNNYSDYINEKIDANAMDRLYRHYRMSVIFRNTLYFAGIAGLIGVTVLSITIPF